LMYRAGWAAAEAALSRSTVEAISKSGRGRATVAAWSTASAALAASIAVAVTMAILGRGGNREIAMGVGNAQSPIVAALELTPSADVMPRRQVVVDPLLERLDALANGTATARSSVREASVWAATHRPRLGRPDQPILASSGAGTTGPTAIDSRTARELLDQLLPSRAKAAGGSVESSGVLNLLRPLTSGGDTI
jgi:hypothetical protein